MTVLNEITAKARLSVPQNPDQLLKETRTLGRLSVSSQDSDPLKEGKCLPCIYPSLFLNLLSFFEFVFIQLFV